MLHWTNSAGKNSKVFWCNFGCSFDQFAPVCSSYAKRPVSLKRLPAFVFGGGPSRGRTLDLLIKSMLHQHVTTALPAVLVQFWAQSHHIFPNFAISAIKYFSMTWA